MPYRPTVSIWTMRTALRAFVDAAGQDARNFRYNRGDGMPDEYSQALGALRSRVGEQVALIAYHYNIELEGELAQILPPPLDDDPSFVPGFEDE